MREQEKRRVENVRLVRLPNGQLVTQDEATRLSKKQQPEAQKSTPTETSKAKKPLFKTRRERKEAAAQANAKPKTTTAPVTRADKDILEVWKQQEEIKKDNEKLALEYEVTKKMAKEIKRKLKEQNKPHDGQSVEEAFKDLLSPETKKLASKLKPIAKKTKSGSKQALKSAKLSSGKYLKFSQIALKNKKISGALGVIAVVIVVGALTFNRLDKPNVSIQGVQGANDATNKIPVNVTPDFATLSPADKSIEDLGGFARVSPDSSAPAYAYKDTIVAIPIRLTQQESPEKFNSNPEQLEKTANDFNANKLIQVDELKVYTGLSDAGQQTTIFVKDGLLVFVTADKEIPEVEWVRYITNLVKK